MRSDTTYIKQLWYLLGENKNNFPYIFLLFLAVSALDLIGLGLIVPFIALIVDPESFTGSSVFQYLEQTLGILGIDDALLWLSGLLLVVFIVKAVSAIAINRLILQFCYKQGAKMRAFLMRSYQGMPYLEHIRRNSSEFIYSIESLAPQYAHGVLQSVLRMLSEGVVVVMIVLFLAWNNIYVLTVLLSLMGGVAYAYIRFFHEKLRSLGREANLSTTKMLQGTNEGMEGIKEIRVLGKESFFYDMVKNGATKFANATVKSTIISTVPKYLFELVLITFVVVVVIGWELFDQKLSELLPILTLFGMAAVRLTPSVNQIVSSITQIRFFRHAVELLYKDMQQLDVLINAKKSDPVNSYSKRKTQFEEIELNDISFSYPSSDYYSLDSINIKIKRGESIGIIGSSGSGKTTLIDVILGLMDPQKGRVTYNGAALSSSDELRSHSAYIPQQIFLIDDSLRNNIVLDLADNYDEIQLKRSIERAQLAELINTLPDGLNTVMGERGVRISGGQRQRVALARALYHNKEILVMDEATSALDAETESEVIEEIKQLKGEITTIVIAHRLTTLRYCDKIYKLSEGRVIESGSYEQVIGDALSV